MIATVISKQVYEDLRITAYHEAGHAALRAVAGFVVQKIIIGPYIRLTGFSGKSIFCGGSNIPKLEEDLDAHLAGALGGYASTLVLLDQNNLPGFSCDDKVLAWFSQGTGGDEDLYFNILRASGAVAPPPDKTSRMHEFHDAARRIAVPKLVKLWPHVEAIAEMIQETVKPHIQVGVKMQPVEIPVSEFEQHLPQKSE